MKKMIFSALITLGLSALIHADDYSVEANAGQLILDSLTTVNAGTPTTTTTTSSIQGITVAKYIDNYFVSLSVSTITFDVDVVTLSTRPSYYISAAANYTVDNDSDFLPFGGAKLSYISQETAGWKSLGYDQDISTLQNIFISANLGVAYDITDQLQLKADYSYPLASIPLIVTLTQTGVTVDTKIEPKGSWSAGLIYNF